MAAWIATAPTSIHEAVSNGSRNAVGDMMPVRFATTIATPVSMKGTLKSTTDSRSEFIINDVRTCKENKTNVYFVQINYCTFKLVMEAYHICFLVDEFCN